MEADSANVNPDFDLLSSTRPEHEALVMPHRSQTIAALLFIMMSGVAAPLSAQSHAEKACRRLSLCLPNEATPNIEACVVALSGARANAAGSTAAELLAPCLETLTCEQLESDVKLPTLCAEYWAAASCRRQLECEAVEPTPETLATCTAMWLSFSDAGEDYALRYGACSSASTCESLRRGSGDECRFDLATERGSPFSLQLLSRMRKALNSQLAEP